MNFKEYGPLITAFAGFAWAIISWLLNNQNTALRGKIKTDLEILEKSKLHMGEDHEVTNLARDHAISLMRLQYREHRTQSAAWVSWPDLALAVFLTASSVWLWLTRAEEWHLAGAFTLAFIALGAFVNAFSSTARLRRAA
ncbi:hypothetical protein LNV23_21830 [Paucibacter sp. DJ1R-11]|uniref:hypothetical protein n=1 Tax=Paucibacter sp. DJ1R-11 TaxID=2893556 RepID=UPI0021E39D99|nr:hypothetical protein [Paucibacter sp. DJ1R-11]MCV2366088.1 hypothetical protein [Paucibacter sp. DJ1R-11]